MEIEKLQSSILTPKTTGYLSAVSLGTSLYSGITKNKTAKKIHKPSAWLALIFTILHVGLIEYYNQKYKK